LIRFQFVFCIASLQIQCLLVAASRPRTIVDRFLSKDLISSKISHKSICNFLSNADDTESERRDGTENRTKDNGWTENAWDVKISDKIPELELEKFQTAKVI